MAHGTLFVVIHSVVSTRAKRRRRRRERKERRASVKASAVWRIILSGFVL